MPSRRTILYLLLSILVFLNLYDLFSTLAWCNSCGIQIEFNPLMRKLLSVGPIAAVAFKVIVVACFVSVMRMCADHNFRLAFNGTVFVVFIYTTLFCWHLVGPMIYLN